jgi:microcystin-dependent protein
MPGTITYDDLLKKLNFDTQIQTSSVSNFSDDSTIATTSYVHSHMPTGMLISFAGSVAPDGWLLCDGSQVSQTIYAKLYAVIGNTYGTALDTSRNFVLPDLRGRNIVGTSGSYPLAQKQGSENVTLEVRHLPTHSHTGTTDSAGSHNHTATDSGHNHLYEDIYFTENRGQGQNLFGTGSSTDNDNDKYARNNYTNTGYANISVESAGSHSHTFTTSSVGSGNSFSIIQPYIAINYLIKYI